MNQKPKDLAMSLPVLPMLQSPPHFELLLGMEHVSQKGFAVYSLAHNLHNVIPANLFQRSIGDAGSADGFGCYTVERSRQFLTPS
jgi:hypothetical protein